MINDMIKLTQERVRSLHRIMTEKTGGDPNIRDTGLLESALESPFASFGGVELYPSVEEKGARLGFSLISNHAFVDGNKRIGMYAMLVFLELNGSPIQPSVPDVARVGLAVAAGEMDYPELYEWVLANRCDC